MNRSLDIWQEGSMFGGENYSLWWHKTPELSPLIDWILSVMPDQPDRQSNLVSSAAKPKGPQSPLRDLVGL